MTNENLRELARYCKVRNAETFFKSLFIIKRMIHKWRRKRLLAEMRKVKEGGNKVLYE